MMGDLPEVVATSVIFKRSPPPIIIWGRYPHPHLQIQFSKDEISPHIWVAARRWGRHNTLKLRFGIYGHPAAGIWESSVFFRKKDKKKAHEEKSGYKNNIFEFLGRFEISAPRAM